MELDSHCPSLNPSMLLKEKFRVSVSCQESSGMGERERRKNLGKFYFSPYLFLSLLYLSGMESPSVYVLLLLVNE